LSHEVEDRIATDADYLHWSLFPEWRLFDFIVLTCERDPRIFEGAAISAVKSLPYWPEVDRRLELARAHVDADIIDEVEPPTRYVEWARQVLIEVPPALVAAVEAYEERAGRRKPAEQPKPIEHLGTRERESLLKLVIGMAVAGYGHDPRARRSDKVAEIAADLERLGIGLSDDTVRKYLREGAELLPRVDPNSPAS